MKEAGIVNMQFCFRTEQTCYHGNKCPRRCILRYDTDVGGVLKHWAVVIDVSNLNGHCRGSIARLVVDIFSCNHLRMEEERESDNSVL